MDELTPYEALMLCLKKSGGTQDSLGDALGCSQQNVSKMVHSGRRVSQKFVLIAEQIFGIPREILRPDIYPRATMVDQGSADRFVGIDFGTRDRRAFKERRVA